jgi:putative lipoic acid-binding regulatory protein
MAVSDLTPPAADQLRYPATVHLSIIGDARDGLADGVQVALAGHEVVAPLTEGLGTTSGRHRALRVSVQVASRDELEALDRTLRAVPGVRMIL